MNKIKNEELQLFLSPKKLKPPIFETVPYHYYKKI